MNSRAAGSASAEEAASAGSAQVARSSWAIPEAERAHGIRAEDADRWIGQHRYADSGYAGSRTRDSDWRSD